MTDLVLTGASRGIGRALALELASRGERLLLVARDAERLASLVAEVEGRGGRAVAVVGDLSSVEGARLLGRRLAELTEPGATLVHNAGIWPSARVLTAEGLETAFVVNHLAPLALQRAMLDAGKLRRIMVVGAGLMTRGRFDARRTPTGEDFSSIRTYCSTKLALAVAMRDVAAEHPEVDVVVLHPGIVQTDLGARGGPVGWLVSRFKRRLERPEVCAARLARVLGREGWAERGEARWLFEEAEQPWPEVASAEGTRQAVREATARWLGGGAR
ncbi:MAG: hypothetical protein JWN44_3655 [Myxococcales bacterium]|nr:hypothetical protein [Myxococcales bacterium]